MSYVTRMAKMLKGKRSYQGDELNQRVSVQQRMIADQRVYEREAEQRYLTERGKLLRYQADLEVMFLLQDRERKKKRKP